MNKARNGFTIIEMMIVLIIITILAGFVFRMMTLAGQKNDIAETKSRIEKISNALEAYRAEYGSYPPVAVYDGIQPIYYEFPVLDESGVGKFISHSMAAQMFNDSKSENKWNEFPLFTFGLASYFYPRYWDTAKGRCPPEFFGDLEAGEIADGRDVSESRIINQWKDHNKRRTTSGGRVSVVDVNKDMIAISKILPLLDTSVSFSKTKNGRVWKMKRNSRGDVDWGLAEFEWNNYKMSGKPHEYDGRLYHNQGINFKDVWGRKLNYQSNPPYDSYRIWSAGVNGATCNPRCENPASCKKCSDDLIAGQQ